MKKIIFLILFGISSLLNGAYFSKIKKEIVIKNNGTVFVKDNISIDFQDEAYESFSENIDNSGVAAVTNVMVTSNGEPVKFSVERKSGYRRNSENEIYSDGTSITQIKFGEKGKEMSGRKNFVISYFLEDAATLKNNKKIIDFNIFRFQDVLVKDFEATISYEDGTPIFKHDLNLNETEKGGKLILEQEGKTVKASGEMLSQGITNISGELNNLNISIIKKTNFSNSYDTSIPSVVSSAFLFAILISFFLLLFLWDKE
jgi:hypothetical protein